MDFTRIVPNLTMSVNQLVNELFVLTARHYVDEVRLFCSKNKTTLTRPLGLKPEQYCYIYMPVYNN